MTHRSSFCLTSLVVLLWFTGCDQIAYRQMNDSNRDVWQQPGHPGLTHPPGSHVADLGAEGGYFTFVLAEAVRPGGKVYAVDTEQESLRFIETEGTQRGGMPRQVELILAAPNDPGLPLHDLDPVFTCNTYHRLQDRVACAQGLARFLRSNGRIAVTDFKKGSWLGSLFGHATAKETLRQEMETAGYRLIVDFDFLPKQHFQVFAPKSRE